MNFEHDDFFISTEPERLNFDFIWQSLNTTYWAQNRPRTVVEESFRNSFCFGLYAKQNQEQVGFARVVTDQATFSWICDVFIAEPHRKKGLGKWLMAVVTNHPVVLNSVSLLGTRDAHGLYEKYGYIRTELMRRPRQEKELPRS